MLKLAKLIFDLQKNIHSLLKRYFLENFQTFLFKFILILHRLDYK